MSAEMLGEIGRPWERGQTVTLRHVLRGRTWCLLPVTVLLDSPDVTVARISAGSQWLAAFEQDGMRRAHTWVTDWRLTLTMWTGDDCTYVLRSGVWYATGWFAPADGSGPGRFYVNAQRPIRRVAGGVETLDLELDVELSPPAFTPMWKDRDKFDRAIRSGVLTSGDANRVVSDVEGAVRVLPAGEDARLLCEMRDVPVPPAALAATDVEAVLGAGRLKEFRGCLL